MKKLLKVERRAYIIDVDGWYLKKSGKEMSITCEVTDATLFFDYGVASCLIEKAKEINHRAKIVSIKVIIEEVK